MKNNFRYIKKNGNFICQNDKYKIEFSKPILVGKNKFSSIKTIQDIETCSYILRIFKSLKNEKWKLINNKQINGFGIFDLKELIYTMIHKKKIGCQKVQIEENTSYLYVLNNIESVSDDFYEISKFWNSNGEILFSFYIGIYTDDFDTDGIYLRNLNYEDLLIWKKCINDFISYAIMIQNQKIRTYNKFHTKCYQFKEGRIYYLDINNPNKIKDIYVENEDTFDILEIEFTDKETFSEKFYNEVIIEKITNKYLLLDNGIKIKSGRIQSIKRYYPSLEDERFKYGVNGVANDFIYALSIEDRNDFSTLSEDDLFEKYGEVILNRTNVGSTLHPISDDLNTFQEKVIKKLIQKLS